MARECSTHGQYIILAVQWASIKHITLLCVLNLFTSKRNIYSLKCNVRVVFGPAHIVQTFYLFVINEEYIGTGIVI
jgi:hypothetical protein